MSAQNSTPRDRGNVFGGSAGGGGYDFQAEAYALIAAKILAEESLNWIEQGGDETPVRISMETGSGGDDLQVVLRGGARIELQAKSGLQRGGPLSTSLLALARVVSADPLVHGVLLTNTEASDTVRTHLRNSLVRLGQGRSDDLPEIAEDFVDQLRQNSISDTTICLRLRIQIRDFNPGSSGEEETLATLRRVIAEPNAAGAARAVLVTDGHDIIKLRGSRDSRALATLISRSGIRLSPSAVNREAVRNAFAEWRVKSNELIGVTSLGIKLPIAKAPVRLHAYDTSEPSATKGSPLEQITRYHEWYGLTQSDYGSDIYGAPEVARSHQSMVIVGGPGSGKSTLLRQLAWLLSSEGQIVLHVSLRTISLRMNDGHTFDEAILDAAAQSFSSSTEALAPLLDESVCLLADGLDETGLNCSSIAQHICEWALANPRRRVIISTRQVGYNPIWFDKWKHFELLPLDDYSLKELAESLLTIKYRDNLPQANRHLSNFLKEVTQSKTASIAAKNPQLLGFLISLHINGIDLNGKRFNLLNKIIDLIRKQTYTDRSFTQLPDTPIANRSLEIIAWSLWQNPTLTEEQLTHELGTVFANELSVQPLKGEQTATQAIRFWEERGLLERINIGNSDVFTFVHLSFQDFGMARFLAGIQRDMFEDWLRAHYHLPQSRQALVLTGATSNLADTIGFLLSIEDPTDPISTTILLAAEVIGEAEDPPPDLVKSVVYHLVSRLSSPIPLVAYEAAEKLEPLALIYPELIGPIALDLTQHHQEWSQEIGCSLGLKCGYEYINVDVLSAVYPHAIETLVRHTRGNRITLVHRPVIQSLIENGTRFLLRDNAPTEHVQLVKEKFRTKYYSIGTDSELEQILAERLTKEEWAELVSERRRLYGDDTRLFSTFLEMDKAFLEIMLEASALQTAAKSVPIDQKLLSIGKVWKLLQIPHVVVGDLLKFRNEERRRAAVEVVKGAILASSTELNQAFSDTRYALRLIEHDVYQFHALRNSIDQQEVSENPNWEFTRREGVDSQLILDAMLHPSIIICAFAADLLANCVDKAIVSTGLKNVLAVGSDFTLAAVAYIASDIWQENAGVMLLERLESNLTDDCAPLIEKLGDVASQPLLSRVESVLREGLKSHNAKLVRAVLKTIEHLHLENSIGE